MTASAGVRAGGDGGRERGAVRPVVDEPSLQFEGEMAFGAADEDRLQQLSEGLVGDLGGDSQTGDLLLVLDHPQLFDRAADVGEAERGGDRAEGAVAGHREVMLLYGHGVGAVRCREVRGGYGGVAVGAGECVDAQGLVGTALRRPLVQRDRADQQVLALAQEQDGALRGWTGQVAHVGWVGDQRGLAAAGLGSVLSLARRAA